MNFTAEHASKVLGRRKTQARRRVRDGEERCRFRAGRIYPVERPARLDEIPANLVERVKARKARRPSTTVGYIEVDEVRRERLGNITFPDVLAEGFRTTPEFKLWVVRHWDPLWVHRQPDDIDDDALVERFDACHADIEVWMLRFHLSQHSPPRYLAARSEIGYVDRRRDPRGRLIALPDEPEANYDERWLDQQAKAARGTLAAHKAGVAAEEQAACELLELHERLRQAQVLAGQYGIDVSKDLFVIQQRVEKVEAALRKQRAA